MLYRYQPLRLRNGIQKGLHPEASNTTHPCVKSAQGHQQCLAMQLFLSMIQGNLSVKPSNLACAILSASIFLSFFALRKASASPPLSNKLAISVPDELVFRPPLSLAPWSFFLPAGHSLFREKFSPPCRALLGWLSSDAVWRARLVDPEEILLEKVFLAVEELL